MNFKVLFTSSSQLNKHSQHRPRCSNYKCETDYSFTIQFIVIKFILPGKTLAFLHFYCYHNVSHNFLFLWSVQCCELIHILTKTILHLVMTVSFQNFSSIANSRIFSVLALLQRCLIYMKGLRPFSPSFSCFVAFSFIAMII